ncbi:ester cyclase [Phenylobacterium sp.]|uniref:ester cyclase n=1 Tax=Phenylobacterium sp. TaxID=1871053 RepID=UPI00301B9A14
MSTTDLELGKALARRALECMETGDLSEIDAVLADDYIQHNHLGPGREPVKAMIRNLRQGIPNLQMRVESLVAEGDMVAARFVIAGRHEGVLNGVSPTGQPLEIRGMDMWRVEDGRLKEHWDAVDRLGFMRQLGLVK